MTAESKLVARCGLYCGACRSYQKGRCPGCRENEKATWCKIRSCCAERKIETCAGCSEFDDPNQCGKFNNLIARAIGLVFNSNRQACVLKIREIGLDDYAVLMAAKGRPSLPRRGHSR